MRASRPWLAVVLVLFCLPLFVGLGRLDLDTDEAIYSFAVDRILEIGDWLEPKSSPSETEVFLEKPPLKFWLVAAPLELGLLPHNEFGMRFWDAVLGAVAFVYVFLTGSLLAGPVCGATAVLLLFTHPPLLLQHGLRGNNMEAPLVAAYCAGIYHFLRWGQAEGAGSRRLHAHVAGIAFVLAFMTKFAAAVFLPMVAGLCAVAAPSYRIRLRRDWRLWGSVALVAAVLILPWFIYAQLRFGRQLWEIILGAHVLVRFTGSLDPGHVQPWNFYFLSMFHGFGTAGGLVVAGLITLLVQTIRRRWREGAVIVVWATIPIVLISFGTSKLYHYAYPFLPPLALAGGYLTALFVMLAPVPLRRLLEWTEDQVARVRPLRTFSARRWASGALNTVIVASAAAALAVAVSGRFRVPLPGGGTLRGSGLVRPLTLLLAAGVLARASARVSRVGVAILAVSVLPVSAYYATWQQLGVSKHPLRSTSECVRRVQAAHGLPHGVYVSRPDRAGMWHPLYYYFRRIQPWMQTNQQSVEELNRYLYDPTEWRPVLIDEQYYRTFARDNRSGIRRAAISPAMVPVFDSLILLPGPYVACSPEAPLHEP